MAGFWISSLMVRVGRGIAAFSSEPHLGWAYLTRNKEAPFLPIPFFSHSGNITPVIRAQSLGGSPPFGVGKFVCASGWPEHLCCAYRCFGRRSARDGGIRGWLTATRHPQFGMRPFQDRAGADAGNSVRHFRGFSKSSRLCFLLFVNFAADIVGPTSCGEGERSARAEIRESRVRR